MNKLIELIGPKKDSIGKTEYLIIFLHGWGSDGNDLIQLANYWYQELPHATFLAPHAPDTCSANPEGKQWFDITTNDNSKMYKELEKAYDLLLTYIHKSLNSYKLEKNKFFLVGFSQGTMLALHTALKEKCLGVVGYSGALLEHGPSKAKVKNKIFLLHGKQDMIVPLDRMESAYEKLQELSLDVKKIVFENLEHSINEEGLNKGREFIKNNL